MPYSEKRAIKASDCIAELVKMGVQRIYCPPGEDLHLGFRRRHGPEH